MSHMASLPFFFAESSLKGMDSLADEEPYVSLDSEDVYAYSKSIGGFRSIISGCN